ncbi:sigma-54-dependent transcriptional regulator [Sphingosinicella terrae]|uniref:sigma-54-dependent transcriptional regulator n=1 Tax=Sphingosinicella terrae TaxID=2172047 RepID=UPI000E0DFDA8|nr:sigma 54-interacting transcriptional regulator [Sphingosinicella terrae]
MRPADPTLIRVVLLGTPGSEFRRAAGMAREAGAEVVMADAPDAALASLRTDGGDLAMVDVELDVADFISRLRAERIAVPVLACGIEASAARAVAAIRAGAFDYLPLPPQRELIAAVILSVGHRVSQPIGADARLLHAIDYARAVAPSSAPILIAGEKGTGKEVVGRMVHERSGRSGRFLVVECAGVSAEIIESELFGHEAGAFDGAVAARTGRLGEAADGTVFLREIGALGAVAQARLAAWLQEDEARIGLNGAARLQRARLIASTSLDLEKLAARGAFRADLLARIGLVRISLPALRERGSDIDLLAGAFAEHLALANGLPVRPFSAEAVRRLRHHGWAGNVRELEDVVHRAVLLAKGATIEPDALVLQDGSAMAAPEASDAPDGPAVEALVGRSMADVERELILHTLERCGGNRTSASSILGISVRTMRNKLKSFIEAGIPVSPAA